MIYYDINYGVLCHFLCHFVVIFCVIYFSFKPVFFTVSVFCPSPMSHPSMSRSLFWTLREAICLPLDMVFAGSGDSKAQSMRSLEALKYPYTKYLFIRICKWISKDLWFIMNNNVLTTTVQFMIFKCPARFGCWRSHQQEKHRGCWANACVVALVAVVVDVLAPRRSRLRLRGTVVGAAPSRKLRKHVFYPQNLGGSSRNMNRPKLGANRWRIDLQSQKRFFLIFSPSQMEMKDVKELEADTATPLLRNTLMRIGATDLPWHSITGKPPCSRPQQDDRWSEVLHSNWVLYFSHSHSIRGVCHLPTVFK